MSTQQIVPPASIAVIGLGNMGVPVSLCLMKAGFSVTGFDVLDAARGRFVAEGGKAVETVGEAISSASVVITLLPDGKVVRAVLEPLKSHLPAGAVIVDMSSSDPVGTKVLGAAMIAAGFGFIDAPLSGGIKRAWNGTLSIMAGGDAATLDRLELVLAAIGRTFRTGILGSGHAMKALNNYVSAAGLLAAVEAVEIGRRFGLNPDLMTDILNASTGRNNSTELKIKQMVLSESFNSGFGLRLMAKDVRTASDLAGNLAVPAPLAQSVAGLWDDAAQGLDPQADHTEIGRHFVRSRKPAT